MYSLTWLPEVLRDAGLEVLEVAGWQTRGHGDMATVLGVLCHHTCGPVKGDLPDVNVLVQGRSDLAGPLCNLGLGRSGKVYMIAAGAGWHAGKGNWLGVTNGNTHLIGIEAENTGETSGPRADIWPAVQMDAYKRTCAAIMKHVGGESAMVAGHKEYCLPHGRKDDPNFDMVAFRAEVAKIMGEMPKAIPAGTPPRVGTININDLNVRSIPAQTGFVVAIHQKGDKVLISGESMNGTTKWLKISEGYVAARYVNI